ncbi:MAG: TlyA family RNA methyltransferase [Clostridia bacterium]|nr:TlyA family RNA methyltransferase [Clostridia bacterium]
MRADQYLTVFGHVQSRKRAQTLIEEGNVTIDGVVVKKSSQQIADGTHEVRVVDTMRYVGRGGYKLEGALKAFGLDVKNVVALDIGASTGGFTDCLLQHGAKRVYAVDAGDGQLVPSLRENPAVVSLERLNARELTPMHIGNELVDLIVMDVSFISATYIIPQFPGLLTEDGRAVCLIKPQFEVGKAMLGKGGIVKEASAHRFAIDRVCDCVRTVGLNPIDLISSPITGGDGNREFLLLIQRNQVDTATLTDARIRAVLNGAGS